MDKSKAGLGIILIGIAYGFNDLLQSLSLSLGATPSLIVQIGLIITAILLIIGEGL